MAFVSNTARDAGPTIAGFFLQVNVSILRWLDIDASQYLELECGEDIDTVERNEENGAEKRLLEQLKLRSRRSLTLRSVEALDALANCCDHIQRNPDTQLLFRYLTTASATVEDGWICGLSGIATWQALRHGDYNDQQRSQAFQALRTFLEQLARPAKISEPRWTLLQTVVADESAFLQLVMAFEWALEQPGLEQTEATICTILRQRGYANDEAHAEIIYEHLVSFVFRRLSTRGRGPLTASDLRVACATQPTRSQIDNELIALIRASIAETNVRLNEIESTVATHATELSGLQQAMKQINKSMGMVGAISISAAAFSTEVPDSVSPRVSRARVVEIVQEKLGQLRMAVLVAEPGSGKTQLLLMLREQTSRPSHWLNIPRDASEAQACIFLDAFIRSFGSGYGTGSFREQLNAAAQSLSNALIVIEDLPRSLPRGRLATRLRQLYDMLPRVDGTLILSSYYHLPATLSEQLGDVHCDVPRFDTYDVVELLQISGAPGNLLTEKTADFIVTVSQGLPVLALETVRYLANNNWAFTLAELEPIFRGDVAAATRQDAPEILRITVPDAKERELIIRMTLAIGPFSQKDIEMVARVPSAIPLPGEVVKRVTGVWFQQVGPDRYLYSPLLGPTLADTLDTNTRRGVHFILGTRILSRGTITPIDAFAAVNHFIQSTILHHAVWVTISILMAFVDLDEPFSDEFGFSRMWPQPIDRAEIDLNFEIYLRAVQIVVIAKLGRPIEHELAQFDALLEEAEHQGWGVAIGAGYLAIHLVWKFSAVASKYLVPALTAFQVAHLPDGSRLPVADYPLESLALMSANTCNSDEDVDAWLTTLKTFTKSQLHTMANSEFAEDNLVIFCDGIWNREQAKPEENRDWQHVKMKLTEIEEVGREVDFPLLEGAAIRGRIIVTAELEEQLDAALQISHSTLQTLADDRGRFLVFEITGKQLILANRNDEARPFLIAALQCNSFKDALLRRDVLVLLADIQDPQADPSPTFYTGQAVVLARSGKLIPSIVVGTLAEHAIAQWRVGDRSAALATLCETTTLVISIREDKVSWKALFYQVFSAITVYSDIAYDGAARVGFEEPNQGWFTQSREKLADGYKPDQVAYICVRIAKLAAGIGDLRLASEWTWKALEFSEGSGEARRVVSQFVLYGLAWELSEDRFDRAGQLCRVYLSLRINELLANRQHASDAEKSEHEAMLANFEKSSVPAMSLMRLRGVMPIVFRIAMMTLRGVNQVEIEKAIALLDNEVVAIPESEGFVEALRTCFIEDHGIEALRAECVAAHGKSQYLKSYTFMLGELIRSSAQQSLYLQVTMMETLGRVFSDEMPIYRNMVAPFFVEFWKAQAEKSLHPFRTAHSYTTRQFDLSDGTVAGTKKLLTAMRFCLGASLPEDAMSWLASS